MALLINRSEEGDLVRVDCTIEELRRAVADMYENPEYLTDEEAWDDAVYKEGWTIHDEEDVETLTLDGGELI